MTPPAPAARAAGLGCLVLVLLPFAAVGVFTMAQGVRFASAESSPR